MKAVEPVFSEKFSVLIFMLTISLSSFLLFQVQPLIGKYILPWFGGVASVWTICMLFFQLTLLAGYLYAHSLMKLRTPIVQSFIHLAIILAAFLTLPITPDVSLATQQAASPVTSILMLLLFTVGMPYFTLSATSTLIQSWFGATHPKKSPYPLFALSNAASLIALLSYPFIIEPAQTLNDQTHWWGYGFGAFCFFMILSSIIHTQSCRQGSTGADKGAGQFDSEHYSLKDYAFWFSLAACASITLLAITNYITLDLASVPFLWVLPLSLYLLSFILCFESSRWYRPKPYYGAFFCLLALICIDLFPGDSMHFIMQISLYLAFLFTVCMICHGELARSKPGLRHLTKFYLIISGGGALGGIFVGLLAPLIFTQILEMHVSLLLMMLLTVWIWSKYTTLATYPKSMRLYAVSIGGMVGFIYFTMIVGSISSLELTRNFYGPVAALERDDSQGRPIRILQHGRISHGFQYQQDGLRQTATSYYSPTSGVGRLMALTNGQKERSIGLIGLGIGTLAAYANPGDTFTFYEINPEVTRLAKSYFSFLEDSAAEISIKHGDGRLMLEKEEAGKFDLLVLDAFSSDSVPTHLLTREAFQLYLSRLKAGGTIAVHISNLHLDFRPVVYSSANTFGLKAVYFDSPGNDDVTGGRSLWMILSQDDAVAEALLAIDHSHPQVEDQRLIEWTDTFTNIFSLLK